MRSFVPLAFLSVFPFHFAAAQDPKPKPDELPAGARKVVAGADAEVEKARKKFQAEAKAIRAKLIADLQAQLDAETKKGNHDGGLAIRREIERVKQRDPEIDGDNPDMVAARKALVGGKWRLKVLGTPYQADLEFHDDGTVTNSDPASQDTKWTIETHGKAKVLKIGVVVFPLPLNAKKLSGFKSTTKEPTELVRLSDK